MQTFKAVLYGPNLPLAGTPVDAYFNGSLLCAAAFHIAVEPSQLTVSIGGFEHNELFLNWLNADGRWALKPQTKSDILIAVETAPPSLQKQLSQWRSRRRYIGFVWGSLGSLATVFVLAVVLLWWQYDRAVAWAADHVSLAKEERLGNSVLEQIKAEGDVIEKGLAVKTIQDIGQRLTDGSRYKYRWLVKKDNTVNAFALPGGIVIVHSALLEKADSADELAAVLAHEVQHVEQRHALKNMIHSLGWAALLMAVLGDVNAATAVIIHQAGQMYFSRDIEDEADRLGYQALVRAKIAPGGMVTFFQKLEKLPGDDLPEWISSHPATGERIKTIQKMLLEQPCGECKTLQVDWKKVEGDKALRKVSRKIHKDGLHSLAA